MMDLTKLFETQKILRDRINYNEPDRFNKLVLALLVEIGECANEWRGFKFWSKDQEPRKKGKWKYSTGIENGKFIDIYENPLLEEYVDGLHFILELGLEINYTNYESLTEPTLINCPIEEIFIFVYETAAQLIIPKELKYYYLVLFMTYHQLGQMLGFTWEEVEQAYYAKNKINHQRQEEGY